MPNDSSAIVSKVPPSLRYGEAGWDFAHVLKNTWAGYGLPVRQTGDDLEVHYRHTLENLGKEPGLVGLIFRKAQNKIAA